MSEICSFLSVSCNFSPPLATFRFPTSLELEHFCYVLIGLKYIQSVHTVDVRKTFFNIFTFVTFFNVFFKFFLV